MEQADQYEWEVYEQRAEQLAAEQERKRQFSHMLASLEAEYHVRMGCLNHLGL